MHNSCPAMAVFVRDEIRVKLPYLNQRSSDHDEFRHLNRKSVISKVCEGARYEHGIYRRWQWGPDCFPAWRPNSLVPLAQDHSPYDSIGALSRTGLRWHGL